VTRRTGILVAQDFGLPLRRDVRGRILPRFFAVDLFCGAGGTTRGLIDAGGYIVCGVDKDTKVARTYLENNPNLSLDKDYPAFLNVDIFPRSENYPAGQQDQLLAYLDVKIAELRVRYPSIPFLFAVCAPCQPFTTLSRKKLSKDRDQARLRDSRLLEEALALVKRYQPEMILSENVAGIRSSKYGNVWNSFEQGLIFGGYLTASDVICTSRFGIAQRRRRSVLVAIKRNLLTPNGTIEIPRSDQTAQVLSVRQALEGLPALRAGERHPSVPNHIAANLSDTNLKRIKAAVPGSTNAMLRETAFGDLRLKCHKRTEKKFRKNCFGDAYGRMDPDQPAPTMTTKCYSITNGRFGHFVQDRAISLREAAAIQSFPHNYKFYPDDQILPVARMIGNAVPPRLAFFFADYTASLLEAQRG
jgi:DNA (cytosine-5)-methyltransferase 1